MFIKTIAKQALSLESQAGLSNKHLKKRYSKFLRTSKKRALKLSLIFANFGLIIIASVFVFVSQRGHVDSEPIIRSSISNQEDQSLALDQVSATDIAATVATVAQLDEATSVQNQADSYTAQVAIGSSDDQVVSKPQVVSAGIETKSNKDIVSYTVVQGDNIPSIAKKFGISSDSVRWSNGLSGDAVSVGKTLWIPPRDGIVYEVKQGDTVDSIAAKYRASKDLIIRVNDAELTGLKVGTRILVPDGLQPAPRPTYSYYFTGFSFGTTAIYGGNGYTYGYCTWHAANRRIDIGRPLPRNLGNASTWLSAARLAGLETGTVPRAGAVLWDTNTSLAGGLGHVAFVEKMNDDGSALVSDMNYPYWNRVTYRTVQPADFSKYRFIY